MLMLPVGMISIIVGLVLWGVVYGIAEFTQNDFDKRKHFIEMWACVLPLFLIVPPFLAIALLF